MSDMPEKIWVPMGDGRFGEPDDVVYTEKVKGATKYIRADKYAELEEHLKSARNDGFDMCKADYREQFAELEEQLMFFLEDWDHCTELGFCPEMGYLKEDWCPWCKTRRLLGLPDAKNWEEHVSQEQE